MGFFDRGKRKDEDGSDSSGTRAEGYFDANVEEISLSKPKPQADSAPQATKRAEPAKAKPSNYGIQKAIELMRMIPFGPNNEEQFVLVIKATLESTNIAVPTIIEDANLKLKNLEGEIELLKEDIKNFEEEIKKRKQRIGELTSDHEETSLVKKRLTLAEQLADKAKGGGKAASKSGVKKAASSTPAKK